MAFDANKYELAGDTPNEWHQVIKGYGLRIFKKEYLNDADCAALVEAGSQYVKSKAVPEAPAKASK